MSRPNVVVSFDGAVINITDPGNNQMFICMRSVASITRTAKKIRFYTDCGDITVFPSSIMTDVDFSRIIAQWKNVCVTY